MWTGGDEFKVSVLRCNLRNPSHRCVVSVYWRGWGGEGGTPWHTGHIADQWSSFSSSGSFTRMFQRSAAHSHTIPPEDNTMEKQTWSLFFPRLRFYITDKETASKSVFSNLCLESSRSGVNRRHNRQLSTRWLCPLCPGLFSDVCLETV